MNPSSCPRGLVRPFIVAAVFVLAACATTPAQQSPEARAQAAIASPIRTDQDRQMDASRNPAQFLPFTGVEPGMIVLDVSAGGGYTSQLLALSVGPEGKVFAQRPSPGEALTKRLAERPQPNFVPVYQPFEDPVPASAPPLDLVTLVNNYHDIAYLPVDRAKMNQRLFAALKPGGRLVVVDHSAKAGHGHQRGQHAASHRPGRRGRGSDASGLRARGARGSSCATPSDTREVSSGDGQVMTDKFALRFVKPS